jgi:phosphate/sulfate permease
MSKGGISPSGRFLRWALWRLPLGATKLSIARNTAAASEEGRRVMALIGFGAWVAVFWYVAWWLYSATGVIVPLQLAGLFGLLLIWRIVGLLRRWWVHRHNLQNMARNAQIQRETYKILTALPGQIQQLARGAPGGMAFTMPNLLRHHDPDHEAQQQAARQQAEESRGWLPQEIRDDMPLGAEFEPTFRWPRFRRRKKDSE